MTPDEQLDTIYDKYQLESEAESVDWPKFKDALIFWRNLAVQNLVYDKQVAENCRLIANADIAGTWLDPKTNKKLYNQAAVDAAVQAARVKQIHKDLYSYSYSMPPRSTRNRNTAFKLYAVKFFNGVVKKRRESQLAALNPQGGTK
jgi:hypothetical protein